MNKNMKHTVVIAGPMGSGKKTIASSFFLDSFLPPNKWKYFLLDNLDPSWLSKFEEKVLIFCYTNDPCINMKYLKQSGNEDISLSTIKNTMKRDLKILPNIHQMFDHIFLLDNSETQSPPIVGASLYKSRPIFQKRNPPQWIEEILQRISPTTENSLSKKLHPPNFHSLIHEHMTEALQTRFLDALELDRNKKRKILIELGIHDSLAKTNTIPLFPYARFNFKP